MSTPAPLTLETPATRPTVADAPRHPRAIVPAPSTAALVEAALAGNGAALGRLLTVHEAAAYRLAHRLLRHEADARDAVQDAFLLVVRAVHGDGAAPRAAERFEPWLMRVVANAALGRLRRRPPAPPTSLDATAAVLPAPAELEPPAAAERREGRVAVLRALLALPETQRTALILREYRELSYDAMGAQLGLDRGATAQLLLRARRRFRAAYEGLATGPGPAGCRELVPLLTAALDDGLAPRSRRRLTGHVGRCARCRNELTGRVRAARPPANGGRPHGHG